MIASSGQTPPSRPDWVCDTLPPRRSAPVPTSAVVWGRATGPARGGEQTG
ncbi:MAG: hypothetical protein AVDCRST_MAG59-1099 [uncultured Thermomicrobiales bacterium]|uniref:Uncharacterized protein n=1 Tax=uncultured Thermomicrobiales bacterium TaxID=1645740 RepID=A0A6J4UAB4_9BACT|nr:MAG: hypothetical protein AVDCRST_MAG59-1099 [uncultured Thermomicrobiales bacterium]